jgi:hypothetical protein
MLTHDPEDRATALRLLTARERAVRR